MNKFYKSGRKIVFLTWATFLLSNYGYSQVVANYSSAKFKNWIAFTGEVGQYVEFPNNAYWKPEPDLTLECWIRLNEPVPTVFQHIFGNCWTNTGSGLEDNWGFGFALVNNRLGFHVIIKANPTNQFEVSSASDTLSACKWYHLAGVKQGQQSRVYINGKLAASRTLPPGVIRTFEGDAHLGTNYTSGFDNWFNGNIDEFRLWNVARTQAQIQATMNDTLIGNEPNLRAYYKFNETGSGNGKVVKNSCQISGSAMNGEIVSTDLVSPKLTHTETLPYPLPPVVPAQPTFCKPGGNFLLSVTSPPGQNSSRFYWFQSNEDTTRIPNTIRSQYLTPFLGQTDTFFVSAVNAQFCESRKVPVLAKVFTPPSASLSVIKTDSCSGTTGTLLVTPLADASYKWYQGPSPTGPFLLANQNSNSLPFSVSEGTTFWTSVQITASPCPSLEIPAIVSVLKEPQTRIVPVDSQACYPLLNSYSFLATGEVGSSFRWSATGAEIQAGGQTDRVKVSWISSPALLTVVQTTQQGCSDTASFNPCLKSTDPLFIPNLITAGTDGRNDSFEIKNLLQYPPCRIQIYNRWGKEVFQSDAYQNNWAGEGPGLYYYLFEVEKKKYQGWVEVVK